jgi:hypothetical protein
VDYTRRTGASSPSRSTVSVGPGQAVADVVRRRRDCSCGQPTAAGLAGVGCGGQGPDVAPGRGCRSLLLDVRSFRWPRVAVPGVRPPGCACEDAPRTTEPTEERQRRGRRYGPAIGPAQPRAAREGTPKSGGPQRRSTRSPGELLLRPYGPPGRRSCGLPVQLPHSWRSWWSLGDPAHSGQPCMRTKIPSRDRRNCIRRADEQAEIHRTGPRPRRRRASGGRGRDQTVTAARSQGR